MSPKLSRRSFLKRVGVGAAGLAASQSLIGSALASGSLASLRALQDMTLTYWVGLSGPTAPIMTSFNEMAAYQVLEEMTGVHIEFQHPPLGQEAEQLNLVIASGLYPDILETNWFNIPGGPSKYLADGVIVRLNDLIEQHAPNLAQILADNPEWRKEVVTDNGDIYAFPFLRSDPFLKVFQGPIVRKDWLDTVGLEVPETIDDWHTMLLAFKDGDPNGNGEGDELPFTPAMGNSPLAGFRQSSSFIGAWGIALEWYQEAGVVKFGMIQPEFQEFLATMAQWYAEGLIDPDFVITDQALMDAKVTGNLVGSFVQNTGGGIGRYLSLMSEDPEFDLAAAPYPVLNRGDTPLFGQIDNTFTGIGAAITTAAQNPEAVAAWLDNAYSEEGRMLFNFGIEGVSYNIIDGYPTYSEDVTNNELPLQQSIARFARATFNGPFVQDKRYMEQFASLPQQQESLEIWQQPTQEKRMPPVTPTEEESQRIASIMNDINTLRDEAVVRTIVGQLPVGEWSTIVDQMMQIGIEEATAIQQAALERYNSR